MNTETFGYALLATGVGMGIVFFFLIVLSVLMVIVRSVFGDRSSDHRGGNASPPRSGDVGARGAVTEHADLEADGAAVVGGADVMDAGVPRWVVAGALAYLSEEEREYAPRSTAWATRSVR